jgi:hypothetical protein
MTAIETFRPTLLVGVGGTGIEIAERVYSLALRTEQGRTGRISVLPFDFDTNDLRRLRATGLRDGYFQLSTDATIERCWRIIPAWRTPGSVRGRGCRPIS